VNAPSGTRAPAAVVRWRRHPRCVGRARVLLRESLDEWGLGALAETAELVLSELLTNAVRHTGASPGREIETHWFPLDGGVRIEVHDAGDGRPVLGAPAPDEQGGRGLLLVEALAARWGVTGRRGPGKAVWAELPLPGEGQPGPEDGEPGRRCAAEPVPTGYAPDGPCVPARRPPA
jgi:serine/threonine-protein kinase RsbW